MSKLENVTTEQTNPLETQSIGKLIFKYSIPAIISGLINSVYNIVDQIFIGNSNIGADGNGATGITFPLVMIITTLAMMFGAGAASAFSLHLGAKEHDKAKSVVGNGITLLLIGGIIVMIVGLSATQPILYAFGGRNTVDESGVLHPTLDYAVEYARIIVAAAPCAMIVTGAGQYIRADGSPRYAMIATLSGAILNCILDPIFIFVFKMGMTGAALATIIGQIISAILVLVYFFRFKSVKLAWRDLILKAKSVSKIFRLGLAAGANQLAVTIVQITMNNVLGKYGELSVYGRANVINAVSVIAKVNSLFASVAFGISQSTQPIIGYNIGNGKPERAKKVFTRAFIIIACICCVALLIFELLPEQLTRLFGNSGDELYYQFAARYFRIFLCGTVFAGIHILCANFFPSIGKGGIGVIVALSRQVICLLPLVLILPLINGWGIDGILWAGPIADVLSCTISLLLVIMEIRKWNVTPDADERQITNT